MPRSWTDVANIALVEIGEDPINTLTSDAAIPRLCNAFIPFSRQEVLCEARFNFATKRAILSPVSGVTPAHGYSYYFSKPSDWLLGMPISSDVPHYTIEGQYLVSDQSVLNIKYLADVTDAGLFTPWAAKAVALHLATTIVSQIEKSDISKQGLLAQYQLYLQKAMRDDSRERPHLPLTPKVWHSARYRSVSYPRIIPEEK